MRVASHADQSVNSVMAKQSCQNQSARSSREKPLYSISYPFSCFTSLVAFSCKCVLRIFFGLRLISAIRTFLSSSLTIDNTKRLYINTVLVILKGTPRSQSSIYQNVPLRTAQLFSMELETGIEPPVVQGLA